uniref:Uncharacterized protein n=1 Tax=Chromera velia CCMP2878 TaxID=1169474 RepID=A0A0G4HA35_9ALVE|mmetsp:Transcript_6393/g.12702  ORF Transcript_6393/g.12702 Transcript_6393/m.12702 type:complete len:240 (-) Transcript_6393:1304-2023(-)|eukprot:Cvel_6051.t1-p1 / transcript=Cvel_6051.t1 / gene=Cvel_6051 / organism=Chromera_velia_CCMP2878 / gene_product=hypothetical protein / transcript_product=hypothetical protein / location=Cvel_scaffold291:1710-3456(+) / protein_length=239 / sequence_SO=supercontig / SO=protein_coding / is_pseudo=false
MVIVSIAKPYLMKFFKDFDANQISLGVTETKLEQLALDEESINDECIANDVPMRVKSGTVGHFRLGRSGGWGSNEMTLAVDGLHIVLEPLAVRGIQQAMRMERKQQQKMHNMPQADQHYLQQQAAQQQAAVQLGDGSQQELEFLRTQNYQLNQEVLQLRNKLQQMEQRMNQQQYAQPSFHHQGAGGGMWGQGAQQQSMLQTSPSTYGQNPQMRGAMNEAQVMQGAEPEPVWYNPATWFQ